MIYSIYLLAILALVGSCYGAFPVDICNVGYLSTSVIATFKESATVYTTPAIAYGKCQKISLTSQASVTYWYNFTNPAYTTTTTSTFQPDDMALGFSMFVYPVSKTSTSSNANVRASYYNSVVGQYNPATTFAFGVLTYSTNGVSINAPDLQVSTSTYLTAWGGSASKDITVSSSQASSGIQITVGFQGSTQTYTSTLLGSSVAASNYRGQTIYTFIMGDVNNSTNPVQIFTYDPFKLNVIPATSSAFSACMSSVSTLILTIVAMIVMLF